MRYNNYHKHTHYSNIATLDVITKPEDYIKRAVELGHNSYFTTEHGFQGNIFEAYTLCEKYNLKCIYAVEAYYVDDMFDRTNRSNYHIVIVAMNENGRKQINRIISKANTDGFYYKPRIDLECLLSLNKNDVVITTACVASRLFKGDNWFEKFFKPVFNHFGNHLYLEVQSHNTDIQKRHNINILKLKEKYNIGLIHANDSHYIFPEDSRYRDLFLKAKGILYEEESDFILDYPDYDTIIKRYKEQGVLDNDEIFEALSNTLVFDEAEGIKLDKEFKIPKINNNIIHNELPYLKDKEMSDDNVLREIIKHSWAKEKKKIDLKDVKKYQEAIYYEMDIVKKCGMARYFILDNIIVNKAVKEYNAVLTRSGRGSAVSFYINKLLGLTEIDRLKAPITLYPTRFMSAERILSSKSLPDIDLNFANVEPVIKASKDILGEDGIYYMVAYKPLQESSAFRLWCKANGYNINDYDEIAKNLDEYVDSKKWGSVIEDSKVFRGVIESIAPSPCSFLLLDKPISEEIGLIKVGDVICCALDGYNCDVYKYLKNDYLTVSVYNIINEVYKLIGRPIDDINTLIKNCDEKVWDIYEKGLTTTINQSDSDFGKQTLKRYKPKSLSELSAWVAAIRPGFASMLNTFLDREEYSTGVDELDKLLKDSFHFMMYQESIMKYLVWLGIEEKATYDIIKKIAKKKFKEEELVELEEKLKDGWIKKVGSSDGFSNTWQVIQDAAHYAFNASHSLSVAIDSLYGAYLKSHYPFEYFSVVLSLYSDDLTRTSNLINESSYFGIKINPIKFGKSGSAYTMDKENNAIYKGIESIKYCNSAIADELLELAKEKDYKNFIELLDDIANKTSVNSKQLKILICLNFFSDFGCNQYLLNVFNLYYGIKEKSKTILPSLRTCSQIKKDKFDTYEKYGLSEYLVKKYAGKETAKQYSQIDNISLLNALISSIPNKSMSVIEQTRFEKEYLGYVTYTNPEMSEDYYICVEYKTYKEQTRPYVTLRNIKTGEEVKTRIKSSKVYRANPFGLFSILNVEHFTMDYKSKMIDGQWGKSDELENILEEYSVIKNSVVE